MDAVHFFDGLITDPGASLLLAEWLAARGDSRSGRFHVIAQQAITGRVVQYARRFAIPRELLDEVRAGSNDSALQAAARRLQCRRNDQAAALIQAITVSLFASPPGSG